MSYQYDEKTAEEQKKVCKEKLVEDLSRALTAIVNLCLRFYVKTWYCYRGDCMIRIICGRKLK